MVNNDAMPVARDGAFPLGAVSGERGCGRGGGPQACLMEKFGTFVSEHGLRFMTVARWLGRLSK